MKLSYEEHGAVALLIASGDFAGDAGDSLRRVANERLEHGARSVILDLANVGVADSAALESLLWLSEETARLGGALRLVAPPQGVREALRVTRLAERFEVSESVETAARSMR